jgi:hypothetical protein
MAAVLELARVAAIVGGVALTSLTYLWELVRRTERRGPTAGCAPISDAAFCWGWSCWSGSTSSPPSPPR